MVARLPSATAIRPLSPLSPLGPCQCDQNRSRLENSQLESQRIGDNSWDSPGHVAVSRTHQHQDGQTLHVTMLLWQQASSACYVLVSMETYRTDCSDITADSID